MAQVNPAIKPEMQTTIETEVKLACGDLGRLRDAGFTLKISTPRHFEDNWLLDSPDQKLFSERAALRFAPVNGRVRTFKGLVPESDISRSR